MQWLSQIDGLPTEVEGPDLDYPAGTRGPMVRSLNLSWYLPEVRDFQPEVWDAFNPP